MPPQLFFDYDSYNYDKPLFNLDQVRQVNPQRHEMEQLSGVVYVDRDNLEMIGFKDVTDDEFWIKGHMPGYPLMPGVLICESVAQCAGFFARKFDILQAGDYIGFGGMDNVRFRAPVYPPCRLIVGLTGAKVKPRVRAEFQFQALVDGVMVANGSIIGVPINRTQSISSRRI
ncbi:MAG: beta-hydroxyacyl-ACP dehydratase [Planctomycetaceae bacterium]|nr:beta-hydroxyacyl-ACP dehydratase [Planctomycetaceae bacterium]